MGMSIDFNQFIPKASGQKQAIDVGTTSELHEAGVVRDIAFKKEYDRDLLNAVNYAEVGFVKSAPVAKEDQKDLNTLAALAGIKMPTVTKAVHERIGGEATNAAKQIELLSTTANAEAFMASPFMKALDQVALA